MLRTNGLGVVVEAVGQSNAYDLLLEVVSTILAIAIPVLLALWRRSAVKSKLQTTLVDAIVRGINEGTDKMSDSDTQIVKRAVKAQAEESGVHQELKDAVDKAKSEDANNGKHSKNGDTTN